MLREGTGADTGPAADGVPDDRRAACTAAAGYPATGAPSGPAARAASAGRPATGAAASDPSARSTANAAHSTPTALTPDVVIVGAGPAGLTAAARLAVRLDGGVLVLDREPEPGGVPRHCRNRGFGLRDLRRPLTGQGYAHALAQRAAAAGAVVLTDATVTGWSDARTLDVTTPEGRLRVSADAVVLATGARERPRHARLIPGDRPASGIYTTGQLLTGLADFTGHRAVILGTEPLSWSTVTTLRRVGCRTALLTTERPTPGSYAQRLRHGATVATRTRISRIDGRNGSLAAVEIEHLVTGQRRTIPCDTLVLTGDWTPDHELARAAHLDLDPVTRAPLVDPTLRTSRPSVYAAGALIHPGGTAANAAATGRRVADQVLAQWGGR
nr:FAD-dependent oxidoreductase [Streptomyces coryli]